MGKSNKIRTFIAIDVIEDVKSTITRIQSELRESRGANVSWARPEGIHLTLKFLGDVDYNDINDLSAAMDECAGKYNQFQVATSIQGAFPDFRRPRVLWLGLDGGEALIRLQKEVETSCRKLGFEYDNKKFHPHLTVGRVKSITPDSRIVEMFRNLHLPEISWKVKDIRVMESQLSPQGAKYRALSIHNLPG